MWREFVEVNIDVDVLRLPVCKYFDGRRHREICIEIVLTDGPPIGEQVWAKLLGNGYVLKLTRRRCDFVPDRVDEEGQRKRVEQAGIHHGPAVEDFFEDAAGWKISECDNAQITQTIGGKAYYYLPPNTKAVVTGGIKMTNKPPRDPLYFWAGLIHEDVEISDINNRVDPHSITIDQP